MSRKTVPVLATIDEWEKLHLLLRDVRDIHEPKSELSKYWPRSIKPVHVSTAKKFIQKIKRIETDNDRGQTCSSKRQTNSL